MFLDTSGLHCVHHKGEVQHAEAVRLFNGAPQAVTHSYVLAEFAAVAQSRRLPRQASLAFLKSLDRSPMLSVVYVERRLHEEALDLLINRLDKTWSLCDAVSFVLMGKLKIAEALTTDHHFEQAGFVRLLKP